MKIVVAMSGGVDSTTAAHLLKNEGHRVIGVLMIFRPAGQEDPALPARARRAAETVGVELRVLNCWDQFEREVVAPFCAEYLRGRTPNPCARCNPRVKFDLLLRLRRELDADAVATGHYARVTCDVAARRGQLRCARNHTKDQSYFLYGLRRDQLDAVVFPLGDYTKPEVLAVAAGAGYEVAGYRESQEFCFAGEEHYANFMRERFDNRFTDGRIVDIAGNVLGRHHGIHHFTIGQRRHLGIATGRPMHVLRIEPETNTVVVGPRAETYRRVFAVTDLNWTSVATPVEAFAAAVKIRAAHPAAPARVEPAPDGRVRVTFDDAQHAVTPGQAAVFYRDDLVLGGGAIDEVLS